jgi:hypothetical protein
LSAAALGWRNSLKNSSRHPTRSRSLGRFHRRSTWRQRVPGCHAKGADDFHSKDGRAVLMGHHDLIEKFLLTGTLLLRTIDFPTFDFKPFDCDKCQPASRN